MKHWLAGFLMLMTGHASAHEWYDPVCCNENDCQAIPTSAVQVTPRGYVVMLYPHEHVGLKGQSGVKSWLVPFKDAKPSPDGKFHACILPWSTETMRCLYAPAGGA